MAMRKRTLVACSSKENRKKDMPFLPREIIVNVLQWLPAEFLHDLGRFVCKNWNEILGVSAFAKSHLLHREGCSFLRQNPIEPFNVQYVQIEDWKFKVKDLSFHFPGLIRGSSDGVLLIVRAIGPGGNFYVANPVKMQVLKLPNPTDIVNMPETGVFKVVCIGRLMSMSFGLFILTMGNSMSWRELDITTEESDLLSGYSSFIYTLSIEGVVSMSQYFGYLAGGVVSMNQYSGYLAGDFILAVDVRNESAHGLKLPLECVGGKWMPVQLGKNLFFMAVLRNQSIQVWLLKDLYRKEWVKLKSFDLSECSDLANSTICPVIWLESQQVLVLHSVRPGKSASLVACSSKNAKCIGLMKLSFRVSYVIAHTNSLVQIY